MWLRITRLTQVQGSVVEPGQVLDVPEPDAIRLVAMGKAVRHEPPDSPSEMIQTREPVMTTRDPAIVARPSRRGKR